MNESVLQEFFVAAATAEQLKQDLDGAVVPIEVNATSQRIVDASGKFQVTSAHLIRLCDAVLAGQLLATELENVGFCLVSSDYFFWDSNTPDGAKVAETVFDWSAPEINFRLTHETMQKFRERLVSGTNLFTPEDAEKDPTRSSIQRAKARS